jgi:hypothetical protein
LTSRVTYEPFYIILIRWLGLVLLVLSIHPPGFAGSRSSSGHSPGRLAAWSLAASDVDGHAREWSVDAYDDDDQDDSAPAQRGDAPSGSDDDVLCGGVDWRIPSGATSLVFSAPTQRGLGPARGYSPDTERPPRAS